MAQFKGSVGYIGEKVFGGKKFYSFTLKGTDGFFRLGTNKPAFKVGAYVEFEADEKMNVQGEVTSLAHRDPEIISGAAAATKAIAPINFREEADAKRQKSIHFQSAHKDAIEMAKFLVTGGFIAMPKTISKQYDAIAALVDMLTNHFYAQFEAGKTDIAIVDPYHDVDPSKEAAEENNNNE